MEENKEASPEKILEKLEFPKEIIEMTNKVLKQIDIFV